MTQVRVLVVDDEPSILAAIRMALEDTGWEIETADTAEQGLARFREAHFDAVVTDKNLPGISGVDLIREIRAVDDQVRIIMITGFASVESSVETLNLGVDAYLEKPFKDIFEISRVLEETLKERTDRWMSGRRLLAVLSEIVKTGEKEKPPQNRGPKLDVLVAAMSAVERARIIAAFDPTYDRVEVAGERAEILRRLHEQGPDLVVVDGASYDSLPNFVQEMKRTAPATACVVLSDALTVQIVKQLIGVQVRALIEVPPDNEAFQRRVEHVVKRARARKFQSTQAPSI